MVAQVSTSVRRPAATVEDVVEVNPIGVARQRRKARR
jgi:hypothetical protein